MKTNNFELTFAIARDVMGWTVPADPDAFQATEFIGTWNRHDKHVLKGIPYKPGILPPESPYAFIWATWKPLEVANDYMEIIDKLNADGHKVFISNMSGNWGCKIISGKDIIISGAFVSTTSLAHAVCMAALMFIEDSRERKVYFFKLQLEDMLRDAKLPAVYRRATVDESNEVYAWPVAVRPGAHAWLGDTDEDKIIGRLEIPAGLSWKECIFEQDAHYIKTSARHNAEPIAA